MKESTSNPENNNEKGIIEVVADGVDFSRRIKELRGRQEKMNSLDGTSRHVEMLATRREESALAIKGDGALEILDNRVEINDLSKEHGGNISKLVEDTRVVEAVAKDIALQKSALEGEYLPSENKDEFILESKKNVDIEDASFEMKENEMKEKPGFLKTADDLIHERAERMRKEQETQNSATAPEKPGFLKTADDLIHERSERIKREREELEAKNKESAEDTSTVVEQEPEAAPEVKNVEDDVDMSYVQMAEGTLYNDTKEEKAVEDGVDMSYVQMAEGTPYTQTETVNEIKTEAVTESAVVSPEAPQPAVTGQYEWDDIVRPINGDVKPIQEIITNLSDESQESKTEVTPEKKRRFTEEEYAAQIEIWKKNIDATQESVENAERALENQKNGVMGRLKAMGLKVVDGYRNLSPAKKVGIGVLLAGASVATGGATTLFTKTLSSASYSRGFYESMLKAEQEKGNEDVNKKWLAARSIAYGTILALATSSLFESISNHFFAPAVADVAPPTPEVAPAIPLEGYTVQPGDNLTKIISNEVISKIEGGEMLSQFQKENIVQNLLAEAKANPDSSLLATLNQFADPNLIHPGDKVNLDSIKSALTAVHTGGAFDGKSLFEHAKNLSNN